MRNCPSVLLKLCLLAVALALVVWFGVVSPAAVLAAFARPGPALVALGLILLGAQLSVLRWHWLLRWQGSPLRLGQVWQISYISWFLGSFLPGAAGGDALRALYVHRECPETRVPAFLTILLDRLLGLAALLLLALGLAAALPGQVMAQPVLAALVGLAAAGLLAMLAAVPLAAWLHQAVAPALGRWPWVAALVRELADAAGKALAGWREQPARLLACLGLGVVGHVLVVLAIVLLARGQGVMALTTGQLGLAGTLAVLANHLPLTPGGVGVGETSFAEICRLLAPGSAVVAYGSVIFAFRLVTLLSYLPGAVALLTYRRGAAAKARSIAASTVSTAASSRPG
jgi:uncharacterized membrane protein YbhN (UPF0104 family)